MFDVRACRSCLTVKGKLEKIGDASKRQYSAITGLQISESDGYPTYFCVECRHHIRKSLAFRRRSRRAHFVLKEIMNVRKQISYSDIVTVNRKKTNLESSLNFWEPSKNPCFLLANEEGQEDDSLKKYDLEQVQYFSRFHSKHLVDIEPDAEPEIPEAVKPEPVETNNQEEEEFTDNIPTNDYLEPEPDIDTTNIDMNDIFKDLTEKERSDDDDYMEPLPKKKQSVAKVKLLKDLAIGNKANVSTLVHTHLMFDIKVLTLEEQKEKFELRKRMHPFMRSLFKCAMCLSVHRNMDELVQHVKYHNERKFAHECKVCKNKFPTEDDLTSHVANCHLYEYTCSACGALCYCQTAAVQHTYAHPSTRFSLNHEAAARREESKQTLSNFTITAMSQRMMTDVMMLKSRPEHSKPHVETDDYLETHRHQCDICSLRFKFRRSVEKHMVMKHRFLYTCNLCKEVFTTRIQALEHYDQAHLKLECEHCGKVFAKASLLRKHLKTRHAPLFPCNICGRDFNEERSYYKHQFVKHGHVSKNDPLLGDPQHKCGECGVQFMSRRSLEVHLISMSHEGAENVPFSCHQCKKLYSNDEELETHFVTCRYVRYPRKCCYCAELLYSGTEYQQHYLDFHPTLQYRYVAQNTICDICGKTIFRPMLESHMRLHSGVSFPCRLCPAMHSTAITHVTHVLANHARRPYRCSLCRRRFKVRGNVKDHILRVHEPAKLFKCEFCAAEFSYFKSLKEHVEKLHDLVIPPIKPKINVKMREKIYVYAHMKIEINELERQYVEQVNVELVDYLEQNSKAADCNDYFIFNPFADEMRLNVKKRIRRRRKKKTELENAVAQITRPDDEMQREINESVVESENTVMEVDNTDDNNDELVTEQKPLEVIENDGHQYVMINGEMYRVATEEDDD